MSGNGYCDGTRRSRAVVVRRDERLPSYHGSTRVRLAGALNQGEAGMFTLQIEHGIKDFGMWKAAFDRDRLTAPRPE